MKINEITFKYGENALQNARIESDGNILDYDVYGEINYTNMLSAAKGLDLISEFYDVKAACALKGKNICAAALGQTVTDAVQKVLDSNPIDFISSVIVVSAEIDSDTAKFFKDSNTIVATGFTKNAIEYLESHGIAYIKVNTPLKDYKNYIPEDIKKTTLGTFIQSPNMSELDKDLFKIVTKQKPTVEQIEDAVFAWKVAKHTYSQSIVIAKDLKTTAVSQGLQTAFIEPALDFSCEMSKDAIIASDMPISVHDVDAAAQGRIGLIIVPFADNDVIKQADKYSISLITTNITNVLC